MTEGKLFTEEDALLRKEIILNRRAIQGNHFIDKLTDACECRLIEAAVNTPSVGFSQPREFVVITNNTRKQQIEQSVETAHLKKSEFFKKQYDYLKLKMEGMLQLIICLCIGHLGRLLILPGLKFRWKKRKEQRNFFNQYI